MPVSQEYVRDERLWLKQEISQEVLLACQVIRGLGGVRRGPLQLAELLFQLDVEERDGELGNNQPLGGRALRVVVRQQHPEHAEQPEQHQQSHEDEETDLPLQRHVKQARHGTTLSEPDRPARAAMIPPHPVQ